MRTDEEGKSCPGTLGEYRDLVEALAFGMKRSAAVAFLDRLIAEQGRDAQVIAPDLQMRMILFPLIRQEEPLVD